MEWFRKRKTSQQSPSQPSDSEGKKIRKLAYAMLVDVPTTQWKSAESNLPGRAVMAFERTAIHTVLDSGKQIKIVRRVRRRSVGAQALSNPTPKYYRRYEFFVDRILMGHEEYPNENTPLEYLGKLFEDIYPRIMDGG